MKSSSSSSSAVSREEFEKLKAEVEAEILAHHNADLEFNYEKWVRGELEAGAGGGGGTGGGTGGGVPTKPSEGRTQNKGANTNPLTWVAVQMKDDATKWKVTDDKGKNVADQFGSKATAQQYIDYYKYVASTGGVTPVTPPDGGGGGTGGGTVSGNLRIYKPKAGGIVYNDAKESGGQGASDGIRYNISNTARIVNRETTFWGIIDKLASGDKMHVSPKIGSHGSTGEGCGLLECSIDYTGGKARLRTEGPHPSYHSCSGGSVATVPKIPIGKEIAFKTVQWLTGGSGDDSSMIEFYYDFAPDSAAGKFNWTKYGSMSYPAGSPPCAIPLVKDGKIVGPAKAQDTMRMNSAFTPAPWKGELVEIEVQNGNPVPAAPVTGRRVGAGGRKVATPKLTNHVPRKEDTAEECDEKE